MGHTEILTLDQVAGGNEDSAAILRPLLHTLTLHLFQSGEGPGKTLPEHAGSVHLGEGQR